MTSKLKTRLAYVAMGIDGGTFRTPEDAAQAIWEAFFSHYGPHRKELIEALMDEGLVAHCINDTDGDGTCGSRKCIACGGPEPKQAEMVPGSWFL